MRTIFSIFIWMYWALCLFVFFLLISVLYLFRIPVLVWILYMTGQIVIDRESMRSAKKIDRLVSPVKNGTPAMIFPEGTRTDDGSLNPFKNGAFKLAKRYNFNILPIVLSGGYRAMPRGNWRAAPKQHFRLSVLDPVSADEFNTESELKEAVYMLINTELTRIQTKSAD